MAEAKTPRRRTTAAAEKTPSENVVQLAPAPAAGLTADQLAQLRRPFPFDAIRFKPQAVNNRENPTSALVTFYLDARLVAERLNEVVGPENWTVTPKPICADNAAGWGSLHFPVETALTVCGVTKTDVGVYQSSKPDDKAVKSSYSDALKRAAVLFGVGVYLYGGIPDLWAGVKVGNNKKVRGFSDAGLKAIEQHYTKALAQLADRFGEPLGHGLAATGNAVPDDDPEPAAPAPAAPPADEPTTDDPLVSRERFSALVDLARSKGLTVDQIKAALQPEHDQFGGYRTSFVEKQEQFLNTITTGGDDPNA